MTNPPLNPEPTADELVARARALSPTLVPRQAEVEERHQYAEDVHAAFAEAGFYRMLVPRRYGGYQVDPETFYRVIVEITRGCSSTGWQLCLGASHALPVATIFPEEVQAEVFGDGHFIAPSVLAPGTVAKPVDGGWDLTGTVRYCSGVPYATHLLTHALPETEGAGVMVVVAPRASWTQLDDWGRLMGMKGSGSHSVRFEGGFVPSRFTVPETPLFAAPIDGGTEGSRLHGTPLYGGRILSFYGMQYGGLRLGMAKAAMDIYEEMMQTRSTLFGRSTYGKPQPRGPRALDPDYHRWFGLIAAKVAAAELAFFGICREWMDLARANVEGTGAFTIADDRRLFLAAGEVADLCWKVMQDYVLPTAGCNEWTTGSRIERLYRDMAMHTALGARQLTDQMLSRELAVELLGADPNTIA